jgi:sulfur-carrier protein
LPQFRIPAALRTLSAGEVTVVVDGSDLVSAIEALEARYPGFKDRLIGSSGELRQFVNVYLNDEDVRLGAGLTSKVGENDEISIVPAVAGGLRSITSRVG